jgi:hypothetical protein
LATSSLGVPASTAESTLNLRSFEYAFMPRGYHIWIDTYGRRCETSSRIPWVGYLSFWQRVPFSCSCAREEAVSVCEGFRDFLRVGVGGRHAKSLTGIQGTFRDEDCCAAQWLKSSGR